MTRAILAIFLATLSPASYTYTHKPWTEELYQYLGRTYNANVEKRARYLQKMFLADESVTEHQVGNRCSSRLRLSLPSLKATTDWHSLRAKFI